MGLIAVTEDLILFPSYSRRVFRLIYIYDIHLEGDKTQNHQLTEYLILKGFLLVASF